MTLNEHGFAGQQFRTAAARRVGKPIQFQVTHLVYSDNYEQVEEEPTEVVVTLMVDPNLDVVRLGAAMGSFGTTLEGFGDASVSSEAKIQRLDSEMPKVKAAMRECLTPPSRMKWDLVADGIDTTVLGQIIRMLTAELSPKNPTQPASSSDGSPATSNSSTDGSGLEGSTPVESPSDGA